MDDKQRKCKKCGSEIQTESKYCSVCGKRRPINSDLSLYLKFTFIVLGSIILLNIIGQLAVSIFHVDDNKMVNLQTSSAETINSTTKYADS